MKATSRFGDRLRRIRKNAGISINRLAVDVDLSPSTISRLEQGIIAPTTEHVARFSRYLALEDHERRSLLMLVEEAYFEQNLDKPFLYSSENLKYLKESTQSPLLYFDWGSIPVLLHTDTYMQDCMRQDRGTLQELRRARKRSLSTSRMHFLVTSYGLLNVRTSKSSHITQLRELSEPSRGGLDLGLLTPASVAKVYMPCSFAVYGNNSVSYELVEDDYWVFEEDEAKKASLIFLELKRQAIYGHAFREAIDAAVEEVWQGSAARYEKGAKRGLD